MPRKPADLLTHAELRVMKVLWDRGPSTARDVQEALKREAKLAYTTVLTTLRILEIKGYITHIKEGRAHRYRVLVDRNAVRHKALSHILKRFFDNAPDLLVLNLVRNRDISPEALEKIRAMIDAQEEEDSS